MKTKLNTYVLVFALISFLSACNTLDTKEGLGATIGGVVGGVLGNTVADENKVLWAVAGAALGAYVGGKIGGYLDEQDRERMAMSTQKTIISGNSSSWTNPENNTKGQTKIVATETKPEPIKVKVLKSKVKKVPPLDIIGATYKAKSISNVRGGPSADYVKVGKLTEGEAVNVVGKVKDQDWYLISQAGVGSGFVWAPLLINAPTEAITPPQDNIDKSDVAEHQVASERICRSVEQSVTLADGSTQKDTVKACQGSNGWEVQEAA